MAFLMVNWELSILHKKEWLENTSFMVVAWYLP